MKVKLDTTGVRQSGWYEYGVRFAFGGTITALAGVIAKRFGPEIGGLFLAFPAILPATATLIEKHEREKKQRSGRKAAGIDAYGAAMGSIGLVAFALIVWKELPQSSLGVVLIIATIAWFLTSVTVWVVRERVWRSLVKKLRSSQHVRAVQHSESFINRRVK